MSTLSLAGAASVTVTVWVFSPSSGLRNTISWLPIVAGWLPMGV